MSSAMKCGVRQNTFKALFTGNRVLSSTLSVLNHGTEKE
jgi:hypothetical protein